MKRWYHKRVIRFIASMLMAVLACITSPALTHLSIASIAQSAPALDQQARSRYTRNDFTQAVGLFQRAAQAYQAADDPIHQALSLSNLSLAYQQLGQWNEAERAISESLVLLQNRKTEHLALAQTLDIAGGLQLARGQTEAALTSWGRATALYQQAQKPDRVLASQTNQAQALQNLGLHRRAISLLNAAFKFPDVVTSEQLKSLAQKTPVSAEAAMALRTLGESRRAIGNLTPAQILLERSRAIATQLKLPDVIALSDLSLGNIARLQEDSKERQSALEFYQQAARVGSPTLRSQALVNQLRFLVDEKQEEAAQALLSQVQQQIEALPPSRSAVESRINLAQTMMHMQGSRLHVAQLLATAVQQSKALGDPRTQAYAIGSLGNVYEKTKQWSDAESLTQQALQLAQQMNAGDISYRWQWQLGRILKAQGKTEPAIAAYQEAVNTIKSLRADLAAASPDVQFSFRDAVEPIHRELVGLLLNSKQPNNLKSARLVIEDLQLVELDNFFREACLNANPKLVDQVDQRAAIIYPILLEDQLAIIVSTPTVGANAQDNLHYYKTAIKRQEVEALALRVRDDLDQATSSQELAIAKLQKLYELLIRPEAADLAASKVDTLVFILDGALRNVPMSALYDGQQYLVEQYSVAIAPGLQLLSPRSLKQERLGALVAGLTDARPPVFSPLPSVKDEVNQIQSEIPSEVLLNQTFTNTAFQKTLSSASFPIVHLATHGQFGGSRDNTFIVTWDGEIKVNELSRVLKTAELSRNGALELLVLSACETAAGDAKSALGLAGVAVRSGARSTIATLWRVNDQSSSTLMGKFYDELANKTDISKAEALRRAQLAILRDPNYAAPFFWSAYVLIGNWT